MRSLSSLVAGVSAKPRTAVAGRWFLHSDGTTSSALNLDTAQRIDLTGALHDALWGEPSRILALESVNPDLGVLARELDCEWDEATFARILRGAGGWGVLFLELTGRCNESCLHCYASSSPAVTTQLEWGSIASVLEDAKALEFGGVQFIGGDPLLSPHLESAVHLASKLGFKKLEVFTNGLALRDPLLDLFSARAVSLAFSVYSHDAAIHDEVTRTPGSHERTSRAIRRSLERGLAVRVVGVEGCVDGQNEKALRDYLTSLGVSGEQVWVDRQRPVGRGIWTEDTRLLEGVANTRHIDKGFPGGGKLCVSYQGDVLPCIFDRRNVLGSLRDKSLRKILESRVEPRRSATPLDLVGEPLACGDCRVRRQMLAKLRW